MKPTMVKIVISFLLFLLSLSNITYAETKTFIKEYTYQASEDDSRNSSRTLALMEVKRLLLEELGIYLESVTEVQNFQLTKDQITTLTAGIVKTEIMDEKWDGKTYWLKARISADRESVVQSIDLLRKNREKIKELEETRRKADELLRENERLREGLKSAESAKREKMQQEYKENIKGLTAIEWYDRRLIDALAGNYPEAIENFSKAIELNPKNASAYFHRGLTYDDFGKKEQAIYDFSKTIELNPNDADAYYYRGSRYSESGKYKQSIADFNRVIKLDPENANAYSLRGHAYSNLNNYKQAIADFNKYIELKPKDDFDHLAYYNRGLTYSNSGDYKQAIHDFNKTIELNPKNALAYYYRGLAYSKSGNRKEALSDYNRVIKLFPVLKALPNYTQP